jgi:sideroflexin-5
MQMASVIFWQWANQTLNGTFPGDSLCPNIASGLTRGVVIVCVNYSNANKSIQMTPSEIACWFFPLCFRVNKFLGDHICRRSVAMCDLEQLRLKANSKRKAYASATVTSVSLAVGLNKIVPRLRSLSPGAKALAQVALIVCCPNVCLCVDSKQRFVPFAAVASAGCVNVTLMRWKEIRDGLF